MPNSAFHRRLPIGAELLDSRNTDIRVWAPRRDRVEVVTSNGVRSLLAREDGGYFSGTIAASAGDRYQFKLDDDERLYPDPASRFQPDGPHAASEIVDPSAFGWTDRGWTGVRPDRQVIYELHVGTFTRAGTWAAAAGELRELARIGITIVEVMPVAEFEGHFGWGYDGVDLFAPSHLYGAPDDFRRFVDMAHAAGVGVILDVVYNHLGPAGNYPREFSRDYFTDRYDNEWGDSINFDGDDAGPVREFYIANAGYWIDEFYLDGLRLDATQSIHDRSAEHILVAIGARARAAAGDRSIFIVAENEPQDTRLARPVAKADAASTRCGTTIFITARWRRSPDAPRPTTATRAARRRSSCLRQSTATCFRVSNTRGSAIGAGRPRGGCRRRRSSRSPRTTTRSRTRYVAIGVTS